MVLNVFLSIVEMQNVCPKWDPMRMKQAEEESGGCVQRSPSVVGGRGLCVHVEGETLVGTELSPLTRKQAKP